MTGQVPRIVVPGSNFSITRIGFGCTKIEARAGLRASRRMLDAALESGIRHFDTAPSYGGGLSEAALGDVLAGVPDVTISTKIGIPRPANPAAVGMATSAYRKCLRPLLSHFPRTKARMLEWAGRERRYSAPPPSESMKRRLGRDEVLRGLEESLRFLKRTYIDVYLLHDADQFELDDELRHLFVQLMRSGSIRAFGLVFGRVAPADLGFGSVTQGLFSEESNGGNVQNEIRMFYGVLRHKWSKPGGKYEALAPGEAVARVLRESADSAVIFSASYPHQIRSLMRQFDNLLDR